MPNKLDNVSVFLFCLVLLNFVKMWNMTEFECKFSEGMFIVIFQTILLTFDEKTLLSLNFVPMSVFEF